MTAAAAAIAVCSCGGIVVVQRMVTAMKWRCKLDAPVRAGFCPLFVCRGSVVCDTPTDVAFNGAVAVVVMAQV